MMDKLEDNPSVISSIHVKIIKNTLFNTAGNWFLLLLNFILIPFMIRKLGIEVYGGAWIVGAIVISFISLIDFGVGNACTKYIAEYHTKNDHDAINILISSGIVFSLIISGTIAGVIILFGNNILSLLGIPLNLRSDAYFVLAIASSILVLVNTTSPMSVILLALQRMDIMNIVVVLTSILNFGMTILVLYMGGGAKGLILGTLGVQIFSILWTIWWAKKLFPQLCPGPTRIDKRVMIQLFHFGGNLQLSRIAQIITFQFDKIIALRFFGPSASALYEITVKVSSLARSIPLVLTSALLPAASELDAKEERVKLLLLYERGSKYMIIFSLLVAGFIFSETELILFTWMGSTIDKQAIETIATLIKLLLVGYFINIVTGAASSIAAGIGRTDLERKMSLALFVASPTLLLVLPQFIGFLGIPIATSISLGIASIYYMYLFCSSINKPISNYFRLFVKPVLCLIISIFIEQVIHGIFMSTEITSRIDGGIFLVILFMVLALGFAANLKYLDAIDEYDYSLAKSLIRRVKWWNRK